jgi:hypothetical protein
MPEAPALISLYFGAWLTFSLGVFPRNYRTFPQSSVSDLKNLKLNRGMSLAAS